LIHAGFSATSALFFILVTGLLLFSGTALHPQVGLSQKNESGKLTSSDDMPAVTMDSCRDAVGKQLSTPTALLFVAACLAFAPTVFKMEGDTLGLVDKSGGVDPFQVKPDATEDESSATSPDDSSTTSGDDSSGDQSDDDSASDNDDSSGDTSNDNSNDGSSD
jgi:hypothetical protein